MTNGNLVLSPASWRPQTSELADLDRRIHGEPPLGKAVAPVTRRFPPGSSWLCAKLYGGPASADAVLLAIDLVKRRLFGKLRLLRSAQRRQECVLDEFLARLYKAQAAGGGHR